MDKLKNMSIRSKQTLVIMLTSGVALLLSCSAFIAYEIIAFHHELVNNVTVLAEAVGSNCAAAIDFNDARSAEETLAALRANHHIEAAAIYTMEANIFAVYQSDPASPLVIPRTPGSGHTFTGNLLSLFHPIEQHGNMIGHIFVASNLNALMERLVLYIGIVALVFIGSMLVVLSLSNRIQRLVSDPILNLAHLAREVAVGKDYSMRAVKKSNDELGQLTDGFNEMLLQIQLRDSALLEARDNLEKRVQERTEELELTHKQLLDASRKAGMAEIATNVLHNVGNVLNSLNVSTALVTSSIKSSKAANLTKLAAMLEENKADLGSFFANDPKGKQIPLYLERLAAHLQTDQEATLRELESLKENIEHINEIVAMQQNYAKVSTILELVRIQDLLEDSLRMNEVSINRHNIKLIRKYEDVPPVRIEKHKVLQILINLIQNARFACVESMHPDKCITISLSHSKGIVYISVADNGIGIPAENLTRVFNHGFTTKPDGHGFGLHSGALAAKEMGGELTATSNGPGTGAVFILELPNPDFS